MTKNKNSFLLEKYSNKETIDFNLKNDKGTLLLLESTESKNNTKILKEIGFDNYINEVEKDVHLRNSKIVLSELFGKPCYLGSEIKKLCNDYDLIIHKVSEYKGVPFQNLPEIINQFIDDNSSDFIVEAAEYTREKKYLYHANHKPVLDNNKEHLFEWIEIETKPAKFKKVSKIKTNYSNWFIMVPRESFLKKTKNTCCTLFYRDNDDSSKITEKDVFTEVYSWGKSYSEFRKYNYFLKHINWDKENIGNRNLENDECDYHFVTFITLLLIIGIATLISIFLYSFLVLTISNIILFLILYFLIRKPCKSYYKLWTI